MQAAGIIAAALLAVGPQAPPQQDQTGPITLEQCTVDSVEMQGVIVSSRIPGVAFLRDVLVEEDDLVTAGQTVAKLDKRLAELDVKVQEEKANNDVNFQYAEAARAVAELNVTKMKAANERVPNTFPEMEIRQAQLESIRSKYQGEQAKHQMTLDGFELQRAKIMLEDHDIKSPVSGKVLEVKLHAGEPVRQGDIILTVLRTDWFRVKGDRPLKDYYRLRKGQRVEVKIVFEDKSVNLPVQQDVYEGHVVAVDAHLTGRCDVIAEIKNDNGLLIPGLRAEMRIYPDEQSPGRRQASNSR